MTPRTGARIAVSFFLLGLTLGAATQAHAQDPAPPAATTTPATAPAATATDPTATDPASLHRRFLDGLRQRGYHDLAVEYADQVIADPDAPEPLRQEFGLEAARSRLDQAVGQPNPDRRFALFDQARARLEAFLGQQPAGRLADEARVQLALLVYQKGIALAQLALDAPDQPQRDARNADARDAYIQARTLYDQAIAPLQAALDSYPSFIDANDPRRAERQRVLNSLLDAELSRALVEYELAQLEPPGSDARNQRLDVAQAAFKDIYDRRRGEQAAVFAHAWQGKCLEEKGELGPAMGIYKEVMDHPAPELADLRRRVMYFQIVVDGKRGDHALAIERAAAWIQQYPDALDTLEGVGTRFELAKNLVAQLPQVAEAEKPNVTQRAAQLLAQVVRVPTPFKPEAVALLKRIRPNAGVDPAALAALTYDNALAQAEAAVSTGDYAEAAALYRQAVRRANPAQQPDLANRARLGWAQSAYLGGRFEEAAVLAEFLARRYPDRDEAPAAAELAIGALVEAYNRDTGNAQQTNLARLVSLAHYTVDTWPQSPQADAARLTLGQIALGQGRYREAAEALEAVSPDSSSHLDAQVQAGEARWRWSLQLRATPQNADQANAQAQAAQDLLEQALAARRQANPAPSDPGLLANLNALAEIHRASQRPGEAIALLQPAADALGTAELPPDRNAARSRLLTILLRSHLADNQTQAAQLVLERLRQTGGNGPETTQLLYELSRSLQAEIDAMAASPDPDQRNQVDQARQTYAAFLTDLASSQQGQTFDSLLFAAESLLALGEAQTALSTLDRIVAEFADDPAFAPGSNTAGPMLRARLKRAEALRRLRQFPEAQAALDALAPDAPRVLERLLEQGYLLEDWAATDPARWKQSYTHWRNLAAQLQRSRTNRLGYYDAMYHVALALEGMGQKSQAIASLRAVMTLAPSVGSPAMKARYQALLDRLQKP